MTTRHVVWPLAALLVVGCNFRIDGVGAGDDTDMAAVQPVTDASVVSDLGSGMSSADLARQVDLANATCSNSCATSCAPCCKESCTNGNGCTQSCPGGGGCNCDFSCSGTNSCSVSCAGGSTCVALADNADDGTLSCSGNATCWLKCGSNLSNSCTLNCMGNASCRIDCGTSVGSCNLNNCSNGPTSCPNNVKVCGRACP